MPRKPSRHLLVKVLSEGTVAEEDMRGSIVESMLSLFGETGLAQANLRLFDYDEKASAGVVRCARDSTEKLRASIALIRSIGQKPVCPYVKAVSGTAKGLRSRRLRSLPG